MKLDIRHRYDCSVDRFWEMYWDDDFTAMLGEGSTFDREVVEERTDGDVLVRRLRFTPHQELPGAAASLLGTTKLVYEQENRFNQATKVLEWKVIPTILPGKLDASGHVTVNSAGDASCEQVIAGEIKVNVMMIGGRIEKAVVAEVEKSWNRTAEVGRAWLAKHGA